MTINQTTQDILHEIYMSLPKCSLQGFGDGFVFLTSFALMVNERKIEYKKEGKLSKFLSNTGLFEIAVVKTPKQICYIREKSAATSEKKATKKQKTSQPEKNNIFFNSSPKQTKDSSSNVIIHLSSIDSLQGVDMIFDYHQRKGEVIDQGMYSAYICLIKNEEILAYFKDKYEKQFITVKSETPIPQPTKPTKKKTKADATTKTTQKQKAKKEKTKYGLLNGTGQKNKTKYELLNGSGKKKKKKEKPNKANKSGRKGIGVFMESKEKGSKTQNDEIYKRRNLSTPKTSGKSQSVFAISVPMGGNNKRY